MFGKAWELKSFNWLLATPVISSTSSAMHGQLVCEAFGLETLQASFAFSAIASKALAMHAGCGKSPHLVSSYSSPSPRSRQSTGDARSAVEKPSSVLWPPLQSPPQALQCVANLRQNPNCIREGCDSKSFKRPLPPLQSRKKLAKHGWLCLKSTLCSQGREN